jgi:acetamidase/formamidase
LRSETKANCLLGRVSRRQDDIGADRPQRCRAHRGRSEETDRAVWIEIKHWPFPVRPFLGVMGVARAEDGQFRTRPPGSFGGNLDVRELCAGAKLYLPVYCPGALFSCGDGHAAQGDGEVCINGIECPLDVTLRFQLHKREPLAGPLVEASEAVAPDTHDDSWMVVECGEDIATAARNATSRMVDLLASRWGMDPVHAYILCSVALRLRLSQVVNEPVYTVSGSISKQILPDRTLFPSR